MNPQHAPAVTGAAGTAGVRGETSSPLFEALTGTLEESPRVAVLDLASATGSNIEFFTRFSCALHIADAVDALASLRAETDPETGRLQTAHLGAEIARHLPEAGGGAFDLILAWDLLNYLEAPVFPAFAARLADLMQRGSRLHAFLWSQPRMPSAPSRFRILDAGRMAFAADGGTRECPRHTQRDLERHLPALSVQRSVLLRSGLQEYVLQA